MARNRRRIALGSLASLVLVTGFSTAVASPVTAKSALVATGETETGTTVSIAKGPDGTYLTARVKDKGIGSTQAIRKPKGSGPARSRTPSNRTNFQTHYFDAEDAHYFDMRFDGEVKKDHPSFPIVKKDDPGSKMPGVSGEFRKLTWDDRTTGTSSYRIYFAPDPPVKDLGGTGMYEMIKVEEVVEIAVDRVALKLPGAEFNPDLKAADQPPLVHLPLVWNSPQAQTASATASVAGISVTATAEPVASYGYRESNFDSDYCPNKGVAWAKGLDTSDAAVCSLTFDQPIAGETLIAGVVYWVTYTQNVYGDSSTGNLGPAAVEEVIPNVNVYERHAIGTRR